ncbi:MULTISPECIES: HD-GYP domain-containing protein [Chitinibacter]|uniref:HD-GYP domain-containing protein n=1 Tax=Chitinibacter TaxID=230666 RepID=UPI00041EB65D|nr:MULTISPECIES: HD domain-containing phosphohydrolase [Chitinibacter]
MPTEIPRQAMPQDESAAYISPEQLQVGLFIHLDLNWMDHPFPFGSFKLKSDEQIKTIKNLGLKQIRYSPEKSDCPPAEAATQALEPAAVSAAAPIEIDPAIAAEMAAKRQRQLEQERRRALLAECTKAFSSAAGTVRKLNREVHSNPKDSVTAATVLVGTMLDTLLTDNDIAIHLMNDKALGDDLYFHSLNTTVLGMMLAREMNFSRAQIEKLALASLLHDCGKVEVPDRILLKTEPLNRAEKSLYEQHCQWGVDTARRAGLDAETQLIIAQHHEHCDGSGYPKQLGIDSIHPLARILAVVNTYDNHCNKINPATSLTPHEGLSLMFAQQKPKFDPAAMNMLIRSLGVYPPGTLVQLSNEYYGLVVAVNASRPLKPQVLVYDPSIPAEQAMVLDLERHPDLNISKALKASQLARPVLSYLNPRKRMTYYFSPSEPQA